MDNSQASYEEINYVGRPDAVHIYKNTKRSFSIGFKVVATNKDDIKLIWKKIDRLKGLAQPAYKPFLTTINPTTEEGTQLPVICDVSLSFIHIGNVTPTIDSPNYGSQDFTDNKDIFIPEKKSETASTNQAGEQ